MEGLLGNRSVSYKHSRFRCTEGIDRRDGRSAPRTPATASLAHTADMTKRAARAIHRGRGAARDARGGAPRTAARLFQGLGGAARLRLEEAHTTDKLTIHTTRHDFHPALFFSKPQQQDRNIQWAKRVLAQYDTSSFGGFVDPLQVEPLFSHAMHRQISTAAVYAIGSLDVMIEAQLLVNATTGDVLVEDRDGTPSLIDWLKGQELPQASRSVLGKS